MAEGRAIVRGCLRRNHPGRYQILAAISAVHTDPVTDWSQVLALYGIRGDLLARLGRATEAQQAFAAAAQLTQNERERAYLLARHDAL